MGILTSCSQKHTRYYIGVSQCSDDEWRHKMNHEIVREALFYDGVEVEIRTAKDNSRNQIEDINYFIDRKVDLLIVAPMRRRLSLLLWRRHTGWEYLLW